MHRIGFICFSLALCIVNLLSCSKETKSQDFQEKKENHKIIVGFSQIGAESAWRIFNTKSMQQAAEQKNIKLLFSDAEQKQENQIKAIRSFIVYQVDVIIFTPIVQDGWDNVLQEAKDAGIPVIVCDRKIKTKDDGLYAGYIGTDTIEEGRKAAMFLKRKFKNKDAHYSILELRGTDGSSASEDRIKGFREVIDKDPRFSVIYSESGDFMRSRGQEIARTILNENGNRLCIDGKKIDIIFSANDGMTLGFLEELEKHGIKTGKSITVVTVDAQQEAVDKLKEGKINCIVECNPNLGSPAMELAEMLASGKSIPRSTIIDEQVFTEFDSKEISERGY